MEKAEENRGNGYLSRDLLVNGKRSFEFSGENEDEIELSLGLSLNGKFGVDPEKDSSNKKLKRSSSSSVTNLNGNNYYEFKFPFDATCQLVRTCSLPVETEEEWRRRKELESFRRFEAKRKRLEKMKSSNSSQGSGSSGISDFESQPTQGPNDSSIKARASACGQSTEHDPKSIAPATARAPETTNEKPPVVPGAIGKEAEEMLKNFMQNMPCVSTKGNGPNGKKIEGFLYGYKKGEEVRIVCVCHGSFLSPAEFVKHGGGGDVDHPLRHIVINPSPML